MNRTGRARLGQETLEIVERGWYENRQGDRVNVQQEIASCLEKTRLYRPEDLETLKPTDQVTETGKTVFEVKNETTLESASRLVVAEENKSVLALNFASAKNAGGGFLGGAQAQEESLARSSALYDSLISQSDYYDANRACGTCLYTDHMILSPHVPVFRHDSGELRDEPYLLSFLTSPAVNAGAIKKNERPKIPQIRAVMARRIQYVLNVALENQYKTLVLGAWGCGVFRNDPAEIAELFSESLLNDPRYQNRFRKVTFAVLDNEQEKIIAPFRERFAA